MSVSPRAFLLTLRELQPTACTHQERAAGRCAGFAVVPEGLTRAIGIFQVRAIETEFATAEWGFWGTGTFINAARSIVEFAFETIGVHRLEVRAVDENGRGNGALAKVDAVKAGVLGRSVLRRGEYLDQALWSIVREDWSQSKAVWGSIVH